MIALGCDHGGYELKQEIMNHLKEQGLEYKDYGTYSEASCDYPDFAKAVAEAILNGECESGILICGTGIGISIAANRYPGIRAANCTDCFMAEATRAHNDTNMLAMGQRVIGEGLALEILNAWLHTDYEGGRHDARIEKMMKLERE